ncbi:hypothetical protein ACOSQ4_010382 [Xanthoceras sorbifolium]
MAYPCTRGLGDSRAYETKRGDGYGCAHGWLTRVGDLEIYRCLGPPNKRLFRTRSRQWRAFWRVSTFNWSFFHNIFPFRTFYADSGADAFYFVYLLCALRFFRITLLP